MTDRAARESEQPSASAPDEIVSAKARLRQAMRQLRREVTDREERSEQLWRHVTTLPALAGAETVLAFTSLPGEPDTRSLLVWCAATGRLVTVPEADVDPAWPDVVIVPGLAFTAAGDRLGQGGGWFDRFLTAARSDCTAIGVCFAEQVVDTIPVEGHDVTMDHVVTDREVVR
jgi:5-formyltetrahydrofolate cyclo-ligase